MKKKMNCHVAQSLSSLFIIGGFGAVMAACGIGELGWNGTLAIVLAVAGVGVIGAGCAIGYGFVICPHCEEPLYDFPRLPSRIPDYCPHWGKPIENP